MAHTYESSIITTKDGLHCQVYANQHPHGKILVKPKYIPFAEIGTNALPCRYLSGKRMNRLNLWIDKPKLKAYMESFKKKYPHYVFFSEDHQNWFFAVDKDNIEKQYDPKHGLSELMQMPEQALDHHLKIVVDFVNFLLKSGISLDKLGVTYSTLVGHYFKNYSDINIVVFGKDNYWKMMEYLKTAQHPELTWKTKEQWLNFREKRKRYQKYTEENFLYHMQRKRSEGYFASTLFVMFAVEEEKEAWCPWGKEVYMPLGLATVKGTVKDNKSSIVRPGCFVLENATLLKSEQPPTQPEFPIKQVVFHSRDYVMHAMNGETIEACGMLEKVTPKNGDPTYYRVVVGYFDAYTSDRREEERIQVVRS